MEKQKIYKTIFMGVVLLTLFNLMVFDTHADVCNAIVDTGDYTSFSAAIDAVGASEKTLLIWNSQTVTANKTVPSNVTLKFFQGGSLSINPGVTVTINGSIDAGLYQIFEGTGSVSFAGGHITEICPQWWGAKGDGATDDTGAVQAADFALDTIDGGRLLFPTGIYLFDNLVISGRAKTYEGVSRGAPTLTTGVQLKCRSTTTNFILVTNASGVQLRNLYINGNNKATNTVRLSQYQADTVLDELVINGCVNNGVNLNLQSIIPNRQVSELKFYGVHTAGSGRPVGSGSGITNILIDSEQSCVIGFYNLKSSGNDWFGNSDVDYGLRIVKGGVTLYTSFMTCIKVNDIRLESGNLTVIHGRSESQADSIYLPNGNGKVCIINYIHGATTDFTTFTQTSPDFLTTLIGGTYTNIINSTSAGLSLIDVGLYPGGAITGLYSWKTTKIDGGKISVPVIARRVVNLNYGATVSIDASQGDLFYLLATNGSSFTISNPSNPSEGQEITMNIQNGYAGAMGTITWGLAFKMAGAFTNPATGTRRVISFYYDGTNWVEISRTAVDGDV